MRRRARQALCQPGRGRHCDTRRPLGRLVRSAADGGNPVTERKRTEMTPERAEALERWLNELNEVIDHTGRHEGHTLEQVGRCVYCSCGYRYQGTLPEQGR